MTIRASVGLGLGNDPAGAAKEAVRIAAARMGTAKIDLALCFYAGAAAVNITKVIYETTQGASLIGCGSAAIMSRDGITNNGVAVMLFSFPKDTHFSTGHTVRGKEKKSFQSGENLGEKLLSGFQDVRRNLGIIFSDGLMEDKSNFIYGLQEKLGQSFPVIGASVCANPDSQKTSVYFNREALDNAACGMLLGGKLNFGLGVKHGWKPLGKPRYVTKATDNTLHEIDNKPAVKIYEEYLASNTEKLRKELKHISLLYPIGIYLPGEEEYLLRNVLRLGPDGALALNGEIREGNEIRLMIGTKESCLKATQQALDEVKTGLQNRPPDFVLAFNSLSRYTLLGRQAAKEIEIIKSGLASGVPFLGIYTYAQLAPLKAIGYQGKTYFHNQTLVILAVKGMN